MQHDATSLYMELSSLAPIELRITNCSSTRNKKVLPQKLVNLNFKSILVKTVIALKKKNGWSKKREMSLSGETFTNCALDMDFQPDGEFKFLSSYAPSKFTGAD